MKRLDQKGQGMTEYILIVALIAIAVIGAVKFFGKKTGESFNNAAGSISDAVNSGVQNGKGNLGGGSGK